MVVQHNLTAINANRYFGINNNKLSKSLEKLSSGYAINRAGDNAAGLAVSEKMRAQIAGINQGVKNAQDGISMVQTFEGALTESDSILQRMRTLAEQSANGTYQNDVDREAIQLEFDQLNDELNQIADTDFNGVVVLNGGEMADGLKAVDSEGAIINGNSGVAVSGDFDYENKQGQIIDAAKAAAAKALTDASDAYAAAEKAFNSTNYDLSANGSAPEWNDVDNNKYGKTQADALWDALGIVDDAGEVDTSSIKSVSITFTFDGTDWKATSGIDNNNQSVDVSGVNTTPATVTDANGNGGFSVDDTNVNAIFDATKAKSGDTITLTFKNDDPNTYAPTNIGFNESSVKISDTAAGVTTADMSIALAGLTDDDMTAATAEALKGLEDVAIEVGYTKETTVGAGDQSRTLTIGGVDVDLGETDPQDLTINGVTYQVTVDGDDITIAADGKDLAKLSIGAAAAAKDGTISGNISISASNFDPASSITATVGKNDALDTSSAATAALDAAKKALTDAQSVNITDYASAKEYLAKTGVSISDSFDQSTATLTYTNNITLQVGARTKDSVNFTFKYDSNGLGELKADMDCSARGLGTDQLSLATQEDANKAIDKIDNAINKVSMVRGTFGAVQNRLEHKIDNLNVNSENLTSAESRIRDTNMAEEMMNFTKNQILSQASQSMLAQANQLPQGVLSLLQ